MSTDPLLRWREEFPILASSNYLISNSLGAMPRAVYDRLRDYADTWATLGVRAWGQPHADHPTWWDLKGAVGDKIAPLMGAPVKTVLVHENASIANSILISGLDFSDTRRDKVVISDQDFPSDVYSVTRNLPPHMQVQMVKSRDGITIDTNELLDAIDERTRLVSLSHVLFRSAYIMPIQAITEKAHRVGAQVLFNGYHSVGVIEFDLAALGVDYYIGGTLKWLCGGPGGVFMYVRPDLVTTLQPRMTGWFAHQRPFAFEVDKFEMREDQYRLANGTPAIAALYAVQPGVEIINAVGVSAIRAKSMRQTALIVERAQREGWKINTPLKPEERGGTITLQPDHSYEISRELLARNIVIDYREGAGIRVAPHFYTTDQEVIACLDAMGEIIATGAWKKHEERRAFVT